MSSSDRKKIEPNFKLVRPGGMPATATEKPLHSTGAVAATLAGTDAKRILAAPQAPEIKAPNEQLIAAQPQSTEQKFCDSIILSLKTALDAKPKTNTNTLGPFECKDFSPDQIHLYKDLQTRIAKLIPEEYNRPNITLHLKGKNRKSADDKADFGLIGGMGPLSDANLITELIHSRKGFLDDFHVVLKSAPPARDEEKRLNAASHKAHSDFHANSIKDFLKTGCTHYCLLSNSAHAKSASKISLGLMALGGRFRGEPFFHLVEEISKNLEKQKPKNVLVLGTLEAAEEKLYPKILKGLKNSVPSALPQPEDQKTLQAYIDLVKSGKNPSIGKQSFVDFLFDQIKKCNPRPTHVLLSCTEIPLYLNTPQADGKIPLTILHEKLATAKIAVKLVDSEERMTHLISNRQALLEWERVKPNKDFKEASTFIHNVSLNIRARMVKINDYLEDTLHKEEKSQGKRVIVETLKNTLEKIFKEINDPTQSLSNKMKAIACIRGNLEMAQIDLIQGVKDYNETLPLLERVSKGGISTGRMGDLLEEMLKDDLMSNQHLIQQIQQKIVPAPAPAHPGGPGPK